MGHPDPQLPDHAHNNSAVPVNGSSTTNTGAAGAGAPTGVKGKGKGGRGGRGIVKGSASKKPAWLAWLSNFGVESLFSGKRTPGVPRTVYCNQDLPPEYYDHKGRPHKEYVYTPNQVITSKYTIITFLPRNLLEQFRRVANVFFAAIAILQFFPEFSTISPGLVLLPLIIVLAITAVKDGYEDIKRHQSDKKVNHTPVQVLSGGAWVNPNHTGAKSKTFVRGIVPSRNKKRKDVEDEEQDPSALEAGMSRTNTNTNIDIAEVTPKAERRRSLASVFGGESKKGAPYWKNSLWEDVRVGDFVRILEDEPIPADMLLCATSEEENVAFVETKNLDGETNLKSRNACSALTDLSSAAACADRRNEFAVELDRPDINMYKLNGAVVRDGARAAVDLQTVLLRGTVLRNTKWAIGVVLFTGVDTKMVLNSGGTPSKRSRVERQMNPQVLLNLGLLALMAVACAIADSSIEKVQYPEGAPWLYNDDVSDDNPRVNGIITFAFALITFQNIVPISLYISIEGVKTCQALFIYFDYDMYYQKTGQATLARSYNLSDDLGQIEYIFSDKTGTLTQNCMVFRQCSVGGVAYRGDPEDEKEDYEDSDVLVKKGAPEKPKDMRPSSSDSTAASTSASGNGGVRHHEGQGDVPDPLAATDVKLSAGVLKRFKDANLAQDLEASANAEPGTESAAHARALNGFFTVLALCHTVIAAIDGQTGALEYKAQSPDEAALVQAAADVGFVFRGRDREILFLQTPFSPEVERYELLNILEFTSARKRMSVVVRKLPSSSEGQVGEEEQESAGKLFLLTKGADNVVFERLKAGADEMNKTTEGHLDEFANSGLRTLTLAYKVIPEDEYEVWSEQYHDALTALDDREEKVEATCDLIERDLRLLGATAIEDKLQDGVPETIADLKAAGIKVWVATGDKLETAIAIGYSTNLIAHDSNIIIIRGGSDEGRPVFQQMVQAVEDYFPESGILEDEDLMSFGSNEPKEPADALDSRPVPMRRLSMGVASVVGEGNGDRPGGYVLVIDGTALNQALADQQHRDLLLNLAMECEGVICCRVSPLQKALVVRLVKDGLGVMTLAIGDGANDVSMIQAADVGVGISGEEGLQAVNSADYAIAQFRFLKRLLLVHGHWSYARNGTMIINFFYKNILCIGVLWWFQIYCGWTSAYAFDYTYLLFWNSFWTIAPVLGIGLFDRIVDADVLMAFPELYRFGRERTWFSLKQFGIYIFDAVVQSVVIFFLMTYTYMTTTARSDGYDVAQYEYTTTMVFAAVTTACLFNGLNTNVWTGWVFFAVFIGILLLWLFTLVYNSISPGWFITDVFGNNHFLFRSAYFWLAQPLIVLLCLLPRWLYRAVQLGYDPGDLETLRYLKRMNPNLDLASLREQDRAGLFRTSTWEPRRSTSRASRRMSSRLSRPVSIRSRQSYIEGGDNMSIRSRSRTPIDPRRASRVDMATGATSVHRGFDFSTEEGGVAIQRIQSNLSEKRASSRHLPLPKSKLGSSLSKRKVSLKMLPSLRRKKPSTATTGSIDE